MSEQRPRPQYGEYATPEQQAAAMGLPAASVSLSLSPDPSARVDLNAPLAKRDVATLHLIDRLASYVLLGLGLVALLQAIPGYLDFGVEFTRVTTSLNLGSYGQPELAKHIGVAVLVVQVVLFVVTALLSLRMMGRGRWSFYIPLIGFVAFALCYLIFIMVLMHADPVLWQRAMTTFG